MKNKKTLKLLSKIFISIIVFFLVSIIVRCLVRNLVIEPFKMDNFFTRILMFDAYKLRKVDEEQEQEIVDFKELYPFEKEFEEKKDSGNSTIDNFESLIDNIMALINNGETKINEYSSEHLVGNGLLRNIAALYEKTIKWNFSSADEYNSIVFLDDGYLTEYNDEVDTNESANNVIKLKEYCDKLNIEFLYVEYPYKISKYDDIDISCVLDFSNQNADSLIEKLISSNIDVLDIREIIHEEGLSHHELFYKTDHHWKVESGFWASQKILEYLSFKYSFDVMPEVLDESLFESKTYKSCFLGSKGKKATLIKTDPDDFTLLYPTYTTRFHLSFPKYGDEKIGDFSMFYDESTFENYDYYNSNIYGSVLKGLNSLTCINNLNYTSDKKILYVTDSFGVVVCPFLALGVSNIDIINILYFDGSLESYIKKTVPDMVILAYNPGVDYYNGSTYFDLR